MHKFFYYFSLSLLLFNSQFILAKSNSSELNSSQSKEFSTAIKSMKEQRRGPFQGIRWFCADGTIHPPRPYPCTKRGGGVQHGYWSNATQKIRKNGVYIANVLTDIDTKQIINADKNLIPSILLEKFLIDYDEGWIFRKAQFYRGAFQVEDEEKAGREILNRLLTDKDWLNNRFGLIVDTARILPHGIATPLVGKIRTLATTINKKDNKFQPLRSKIHGRPDSRDAERVREFKSKYGRKSTNKNLEELATLIDQLASSVDQTKVLEELRKKTTSKTVQEKIIESITILKEAKSPQKEYAEIASTMAWLRKNILEFKQSNRLAVVDTLLKLDQAGFVLLQQLKNQHSTLSRIQMMERLFSNVDALYGIGLISAYEYQNLQSSKLEVKNEIKLDQYRNLIAYLEKVSIWSERRISFFYEVVLKKWHSIEPLVEQFIPDRLRGTHLLEFAALLDQLNVDVGHLSGIEHSLFGQKTATGLTRINPGVATGKLVTIDQLDDPNLKTEETIVIVPETIAELPPVAGILTQFEGNQLSHVQLLARNLGVPNIVVSASKLEIINKKIGEWISVAASPKGIIEIDLTSPPKKEVLKNRNQSGVEIVVNLNKLDLSYTTITPTSELKATDSGVRTGPKAAHVGELQSHYPKSVSPGLAIPFGAFSNILQRNFKNSGKTTFQWMIENYKVLNDLKGDTKAYNNKRDNFLEELREWIIATPLDKAFVKELKQKMDQHFGKDGSYGVFIRSDTNVEDLPGFTGAGLNLTLPHVVGFEKTLQGLKKVWASPFTTRAFGWRQALLDKPEHVYTAVLLHKSVNSDKSGVLVDTDLFSQNKEKGFTVVLNEGVGGGVDGLSAETIVSSKQAQKTKLYASATAPKKRVLSPSGGVIEVDTSGQDQLLTKNNIERLNTFVNDLPKWFSTKSNRVNADVEFGFYNDELILFQIRPFLENKASLSNPVLKALDRKLDKQRNKIIDLTKLINNK